MPFVDAAGVQVNFPFHPYDCQVSYMQKVVESLKLSSNAILESPTGTGKTLCLLCSSLAWLEDKKAQIASQRWKIAGGAAENQQNSLDVFKESLANQLDDAAGQWSGELAPPRIIYASRTHSQLTQVVQELKRTAYSHFKVCVLGSREQLCIHPQVMKEESNTTKVHLCRAKVSARSCHFYNNVENSKQNFTNQVLDVEDLVKLGKKHNCCPYYTSKELKNEAEIIFLPYNYLLDPKSRKAHGVELNNNIIIFDEAHNLKIMTTSQQETMYTKIFVGGLAYHTDDERLEKFFLQFGAVDEAVVITDRITGKSKGYGFVTMGDKSSAERAVDDPNPIIDGRKANVNLAYMGAKPRTFQPTFTFNGGFPGGIMPVGPMGNMTQPGSYTLPTPQLPATPQYVLTPSGYVAATLPGAGANYLSPHPHNTANNTPSAATTTQTSGVSSQQSHNQQKQQEFPQYQYPALGYNQAFAYSALAAAQQQTAMYAAAKYMSVPPTSATAGYYASMAPPTPQVYFTGAGGASSAPAIHTPQSQFQGQENRTQ